MQIEKTNLDGCFLLKPRVFEDERGSFFETFNQQVFEQTTGLNVNFVQDNQSISKYGALRGIHLQTGDHSQAKLVRVIQGEVLDVAVDLRKDSPSFGKSYQVKLNHKNNYQLFIPKGFGHGFVTLSKQAIFAYKCDAYYHKASEAGIIYNDPTLNINWQIPAEELLLSPKDQVLPTLKKANWL
ncbi:dTDP-4-dehydrorhamnose 3,5-epimerase [Mesonia sediminis]|uniref:dTDP-4-dehydrorhamnose 3,5-epimerase n=1 Tax=Mesonia sediminis TaxID=1703946 RepID=A0ABW5SG62_9FLAO